MKASEVHHLTSEEITSEELRIRRQLYDLKCQAVTEQLENPRQIRALRKDIARLLTERQARSAKEKA